MADYLTPAEAAEYLRFPTINAFRKWLGRHHVPAWRSGRTVLYRRDVLDAMGERKPSISRRSGVGLRSSRVQTASQIPQGITDSLVLHEDNVGGQNLPV